MKSLCFVVVVAAAAVVLAVSAETQKTMGNYHLMDNLFESPRELSSDYILELDDSGTQVVSSSLDPAEPGLYRYCQIMKCFPKKSRFQVCICIRWRK